MVAVVKEKFRFFVLWMCGYFVMLTVGSALILLVLFFLSLYGIEIDSSASTEAWRYTVTHGAAGN